MGVLLRFGRRRGDEPLPVEEDPTELAVRLFDCRYCGSLAGHPCTSNGEPTVVPHQLRLDLVENLVDPHWLVSGGMTEQCVCHLGDDHDELGQPVT